jgi:hypothetical protein
MGQTCLPSAPPQRTAARRCRPPVKLTPLRHGKGAQDMESRGMAPRSSEVPVIARASSMPPHGGPHGDVNDPSRRARRGSSSARTARHRPARAGAGSSTGSRSTRHVPAGGERAASDGPSPSCIEESCREPPQAGLRSGLSRSSPPTVADACDGLVEDGLSQCIQGADATSHRLSCVIERQAQRPNVAVLARERDNRCLDLFIAGKACCGCP